MPLRRSLRIAAGLLCLLSSGVDVAAHQAVDPSILKKIRNVPSQAIPDRDKRIEEGRQLFFKGTFGGNGRTCGTCHAATNNFTIDPAFIRTLSPRDPLFVAEFKPELRELENPDLLRRFGLITENLDGFDQPGVLRGVPHTLALGGSRKPEAGTPPAALDEVLGWSGDGSPGRGTCASSPSVRWCSISPRR